jgi:pimeloyl-ACP methyl ester carboxylesterase
MPERYARLPDGVTLCWDEHGDPSGPPLLLIAGIGSQMVYWRPGLLDALAARGLRLIRFDNRDAGLSTHLDGMPDLGALFGGDASQARYTLDDMAADAGGLLDALGLPSAHVLGISMGGMVGQQLAVNAPERVRSLVSVMSTTGEHAVSAPTPEAQAALLQPRPRNADEAELRAVAFAHAVGSPGMVDEEWIRTLARQAFERAFDPAGFARQLAAIHASGDRTAGLRAIVAPTLVIHGELDPLIPLAAGRATAAAIDGSELVVIEGMGHDLPEPLWPRIADAIAGHVDRVEARAVR